MWGYLIGTLVGVGVIAWLIDNIGGGSSKNKPHTIDDFKKIVDKI